MKTTIINRIALLSAILFFATAGSVQATIRTVTSDVVKTNNGQEGEFLYEISRLQENDILTFDVNTINLSLDEREQFVVFLFNKPITIRGNGVTLTSIPPDELKDLFVELGNLIGYLQFENCRIENVHFEMPVQATSCRFVNCTFKPDTYLPDRNSVSNYYTNYFEGCTFLSEGTRMAWVEMRGGHAQFTSCTVINETNHRTFVRQSPESSSVTFTNCVLLDPDASAVSPSVADQVTVSTNGYNVFRGAMTWTPFSSDYVLTDLTEQPLMYEDGIYKVTSSTVPFGGAAYRRLSSNPGTIPELAGVNFPQYDLKGNEINYAKQTHSGAWQTVYGTEVDDNTVTVTDVTVNFPANLTLFSDTTYRFTAYVSQDGAADLNVTWECNNPNLTITPSGTGRRNASFQVENITDDTSVTITLTVKDKDDKEIFVKPYTITLKRYIHISGVTLTGPSTITFGYESGLRAIVLPANANWQELEWTVDNPAVASITVHGDSVTVKGLTEGTATVMATAKDSRFQANSSAPLTVSRPDYSDGVFIVNEDWFGHRPGSVNFLYNDGHIDYEVFRHANHTPLYTLGVTTQYGAIYGGKFYLISKQGVRLAVADARTMELRKGFFAMGGDGRSVFGVDEHTGYVGTSSGVRVVNFDELPNVPGNHVENGQTDPNLVIMLPGQDIAALQSGGGVYSGQVTTMKRVGDRVFALQQGLLHIINPFSHRLEATLNDHIYITMTQSKDGYLWLGTSGTVPTGDAWDPQGEITGSDGELTNYFVRLDPWTLEQKVVPLPGGITGTGSTYGAWQADAFQGCALNDVLYWKSGNQTILRYNIMTNRVDTVLDLTDMPKHPDSAAPWTLYGTSFAVDHKTGELIVTTGTYIISCCINQRNNWKILRVNPNGGQPRADAQGVIGNIMGQYPLKKQYWFPAMPVFPDAHLPEFTSASFPPAITLNGTHAVDSLGLIDKVSDADNMRSSIVTTVEDGYNNQLVNAFIWRDTLVVAARKAIPAGQPAESTTLILKFNSNGHVLRKDLTVTVEPGSVATIPVTGVTLSQTASTLTVGQTLQLTATVAPADAANRAVTWTSDNPAVASVDQNGLVTALLPSSSARITVTTQEGNFTAVCTVTTQSAGSGTVAVTGVTLSHATAELIAGQTLQLAAAVAPSNAANRAVTWTSSHPAIASVNAAGLVTAHAATGVALITVRTDDGGFTAACAVTTRPAGGTVVNPFELTQHTLSLYPDQTVTLSLTAPQHFNVTWYSSNTSVATVNSNGTVRSVAAGTAFITARDVTQGKSDVCVVTVNATPAPPQSTERITLNTSQLSLLQGETSRLTATLSAGLADRTITWSASNPSVADVTSDGTVIALVPGACTIKATIDTYEASCVVTVSAYGGQVTVGNVEENDASVLIPTDPQATYYLIHLYRKTGLQLEPHYTLKMTPDGRVAMLRSTGRALSLLLNYLEPGISYVADIETIRETNGRADVIRSETVGFTTRGATGTEAIASAEARVWYAGGTLHLENLAGHTVSLFNLSGQGVAVFRVGADEESRHLNLPAGVYFVSAEKAGSRKMFKIVIL
jgi:uncharacterized protein YjdB